MFVVASLLTVCGTGSAKAETGREAWLRYTSLEESAKARTKHLPRRLIVLGSGRILRSAETELLRGFQGMLGERIAVSADSNGQGALILGTVTELEKIDSTLRPPSALGEEGFWLAERKWHGHDSLIIAGATERGVLYGAFALLSKIDRGVDLSGVNEVQKPPVPLRWVNEWDNLDGSIERGYGGRSIFFENGRVREDLSRVQEYARLLASVGINGCAINNVNADPRLLEKEYFPQLERIAAIFREWGIHLAISIDLSSPSRIGGLSTFDPSDPQVGQWWREETEEIYRAIPEFGGFVVKADSEGRAGPASYGRSPAEAANVIARALKPHGGVVFYRAFVYDHHLDWNNPKNDRARAAYDIFHPLDGSFEDNVIVQIKHGPIDFQVREPVSPLFGGLRKTNVAMELQITQEYLGQQRHLCFLAPMWKEILDFDLRATEKSTPVKEIVAGKTFRRPFGGLVGVADVGLSDSWLGNPMAMANLYAFGRLAWNPELTPAAIADEWTRLTFGNNAAVVKAIVQMQLSSWRTYENYTGPLGLQTLTDILGSHFGPNVEASERNGWGQWHRADREGVGMDRTVSTGTGFAGQYAPPVASQFESLESTPDELLLFFHHVPYTYRLKSGQIVIQQIYDLHYEGAQQAADYVRQWESLKGRVDQEAYALVLARLEFQAAHAIVWRDAVCNWFLGASGISDSHHRVGNYPDRTEAEGMQLHGYSPVDVLPRENASGGKAIECSETQGCTASFRFERETGKYDLDVVYFDQNNGISRFKVFVDERVVSEWNADDTLPATKIGGDSSSRHHIRGLTLHRGDEIRIEGIPDQQEHAGLDYVEIMPAKQ